MRATCARFPPVGRGSCRMRGLTLRAQDNGTPSKTGEFDEARRRSACEARTGLDAHGSWPPSRSAAQTSRLPLLASRYHTWKSQLLRALDMMGAAGALGGVHVYQLRHGGASHDFVTKARTLKEVRGRGRWRSWASVRRYEKRSRVAQMLHWLPAPLLDRARHGQGAAPACHALLCVDGQEG